jgi:two-component system, LytTR family, sensor kinase
MAIAVPLLALLFNLINFLPAYFSSGARFITFTLVSLLCFTLYFIICRAIAAFLKKRYPAEGQLYFRLSIAIFTFLVFTALFLYALLYGYQRIGWFTYTFNEIAFVWSYIILSIANIFLTFLMEGIDHYMHWKESHRETEKLHAAYKQSQLNGLKSQVNPHFLFNSLNSLSSLIQEDEGRAETFLNEMSKVYRYMLRNDEDPLVTLDTELTFLSSYMHLLQARFGESLQLHINIAGEDRKKMLAPLTLQVLLENAFTQNILSRQAPLVVEIASDGNNGIVVKNNMQPKTVGGAIDFEAGLDNLVRKYELLGKIIGVDEVGQKQRIVTIPLITNTKEAVL